MVFRPCGTNQLRDLRDNHGLWTVARQQFLFVALAAVFFLQLTAFSPVAATGAALGWQDPETGESVAEQEKATAEKSDTEKPQENEAEAKESGDQPDATEVESSDGFRSEHFLPQTTKAWLSIKSIADLEAGFNETGFGKLATDPDLSPVVESLESQITDWLDKRNVKFALNMEKLNTLSDGELCFAGVLNRVGAEADSVRHAFVILADTKGHQQDLERLMADVETDLTARGATSSELEVHGETATRWQLKRPKGIARADSAYFIEVDDKLVVCDDQAVFAEVVGAIKDPGNYQASLANYEPFKKIRERVAVPDDTSQAMIRWFIEPFGYVELSDAIRDRNPAARLDPNATEPKEIAAILKRQGFSVVKGSGGDIRLSYQDFEFLHRGFTYAPPVSEEERFEKAAKMLDFVNRGERIEMESWIPADAATCATIHWNFSRGLEGIGMLFDEFTKPGNWETVVNGWKTGSERIKFDVYELVEKLDGKISFYSDFEEPIVEGSERLVVGIKIKPENEQWVANELEGFFKPQKNKWKPIREGRLTIWKSQKQEKEPDILGELDELDQLDELEGLDTEESVDAEEERPLFPEQYLTVANDHIYFSNDLEYLKKSLVEAEEKMSDSAELQRLNGYLDELSPKVDSIRQFGRVDRSIKFIYELLRKNQIPRDNSIFGKMMQRMQQGDMAQKIDGSKLPQDFENVVAPYLGLSGWSFEVEPDGWFFIGIMIPRE